MVQRTLTLANAAGLHARPASLLVQTANQFAGTEVTLTKDGKTVGARSLLSVLSLGATAGSAITIRCDGPREEEALAALVALVEGGFGE